MGTQGALTTFRNAFNHITWSSSANGACSVVAEIQLLHVSSAYSSHNTLWAEKWFNVFGRSAHSEVCMAHTVSGYRQQPVSLAESPLVAWQPHNTSREWLVYNSLGHITTYKATTCSSAFIWIKQKANRLLGVGSYLAHRHERGTDLLIYLSAKKQLSKSKWAHSYNLELLVLNHKLNFTI